MNISGISLRMLIAIRESVLLGTYPKKLNLFDLRRVILGKIPYGSILVWKEKRNDKNYTW